MVPDHEAKICDISISEILTYSPLWQGKLPYRKSSTYQNQVKLKF